MFRTTPPPEGMGVASKRFVTGSNRTSVFGWTPDSLYQTNPSAVVAIPYGLEPGPPGERHSSTLPELGSSRPSMPRA